MTGTDVVLGLWSGLWTLLGGSDCLLTVLSIDCGGGLGSSLMMMVSFILLIFKEFLPTQEPDLCVWREFLFL